MENPQNRSSRTLPADDLTLADITVFLWNRKLLILVCTVLCAAGGVWYALRAPVVYHADAILALKESGKSGSSSVLSQLGGGFPGGLGSIVNAQLNPANSKLEWIQIIAKTEEVAQTVIEKHDLLPRLFPELWDSTKGSWKVKDSSRIPTLRSGSTRLRSRILSVSVNMKTSVLVIGINTHDPKLAADMVTHYVDEIRSTVQRNAKNEAEANSRYLEQRLEETADPWLREKIQGLLAAEIEKNMFTTSDPFQVLQKPVVPLKRTKPDRKMIVLISVAIGLVLSVSLCFFLEFVATVRRKMSHETSTPNGKSGSHP